MRYLPREALRFYGRHRRHYTEKVLIRGPDASSAGLRTIRQVDVRRMRPDELYSAVSVWREANVARGAPHGRERTARVRAKLSASDALAFVALRPGIVGMALAEPGRFDDGADESDPSLLHISMVFVHSAAKRP